MRHRGWIGSRDTHMAERQHLFDRVVTRAPSRSPLEPLEAPIARSGPRGNDALVLAIPVIFRLGPAGYEQLEHARGVGARLSAAELLAEILATTDQTLAKLRDLSTLLRPPQLDALGHTREQREVRAAAVPGRTQRVRRARGDAPVRLQE